MIKLGLGINQKMVKLKDKFLRWGFSNLPAKPYADEYEYQNAICAVVRNEEDILEEWVLFHLSIGIEYFLLWDDHSTDNSRKILKVYEEAGVVEWRNFEYEEFRVSRQLQIYNRSIRLLRYKAKWVWFLDSDEFIVPAKSDTISELMEGISQDPDVGAVAVNWLFFGTAGVEDIRPGEWYIEKLTQRAPLDWQNHRYFKCGVRPEAAAVFIKQPHYPVLHRGKKLISANSTLHHDGLINFDFLRLHHYWHRTEKFYKNKKIARKEFLSGRIRSPKALTLHHEVHNKVFDDYIRRFFPKMIEIKNNFMGARKY